MKWLRIRKQEKKTFTKYDISSTIKNCNFKLPFNATKYTTYTDHVIIIRIKKKNWRHFREWFINKYI